MERTLVIGSALSLARRLPQPGITHHPPVRTHPKHAAELLRAGKVGLVVILALAPAMVPLHQRSEPDLGPFQPRGAHLGRLTHGERQTAEREQVGGGGEAEIEILAALYPGTGHVVEGPATGAISAQSEIDRL